MATIYKKLGNNIRKIRKKKGLTQEELAERARIDPKSIIEIEEGNWIGPSKGCAPLKQ